MPLPDQLLKTLLIPVVDCAAVSVPEALHSATVALLEQGVVKLKSAFDPALIDAWREQFETATLAVAERGQFPYRHVSLGDRRHHYTLEIHRAFNDAQFYANRFLYGIATAALEGDFMLATAAIAYAEPGAPAQYIHRDQPMMFAGARLNSVLPPVSITVSVPLVPTGEVIGGTEFVIGSHRQTELPENPRFQRATTEPGDCLLWDSRVFHRGCINPGKTPRPIVLLYYQRPWFFNFRNYEKDCEIKITTGNLARVPQQYQHLLDWCHKLFVPPVFSAGSDGLCSCGSGLDYAGCHRLMS